jgi:hypothetical protein
VGGPVGGGEELLVERVPRRADFWASPPRQTVRVRISVKAVLRAAAARAAAARLRRGPLSARASRPCTAHLCLPRLASARAGARGRVGRDEPVAALRRPARCASLWAQISREHAARKYSKCSDWIPPELLALGAVHVVASRDEGQGTQFCAPYEKLLPPPLATAPQAAECASARKARSRS